MVKSEDQEEAYHKFVKWMATKSSQEFRLGGLAGTGKTTMVRRFREKMGDCEVITPTAKAAEVLTKKGVPASTVHSLFYRFQREEIDENGKSKPIFIEKKTDVDFLIVDEASMITEKMRNQILRYSNRVVWVGDYGQLPPVETDAEAGLSGVLKEDNLDAKLTNIHRTGDASILDFAGFLRGGGNPLEFKSDSDSVRVSKLIQSPDDLANDLAKSGEWPVICATNSAVGKMNEAFRRVFGITKPLQSGLKIVCTKNNFVHKICNGQMFTVKYVQYSTIETECGRSFPVSFTKANNKSIVEIADGFAITCHKAQGSEWPNIAVIEDIHSIPQWRYTAATRVQNRILYFARG